MKVKILIAVIMGVTLSLGVLTHIQAEKPKQEDVPQAPKLTKEQKDLEHRQEVWISALEWCESRGRNDALNKMDRDGTPSYSNFQWKPSTLLFFGKFYGLIATTTQLSDVPKLLQDYELQRNILRSMVKDKNTEWYQQFPDCTKRKIGLPPVK